MIFDFGGRPSDSPFVEGIWRTTSDGAGGSFVSRAESHWEMVITKQYGRTTLSLRGPETKASSAPIPENAEFFGIIFKLGIFMPHLPTIELVDGGIHLPQLTSNTFQLHGASWEFPTYDNADTFIDRLVRGGLLVREPLVEAALEGHLKQIKELSLRSVQRRFLRATGLTHGTIYQINRAKQAVSLLQMGVSISDVVDLAGYADQPHLTRALRRFVGQTPAQIVTGNSTTTSPILTASAFV